MIFTAGLLLCFTSFGQIGPITPLDGTIAVRVPCPGLSASLQRQSVGEGPCCYALVLGNELGTPSSFSLSLGAGTITCAYGMGAGWKQTPVNVPPNTKQITWQYAPVMPKGSIKLANVCLQLDKPTWVYFSWASPAGKLICRDSALLQDCLYELTSNCPRPLIRDEGFSMKPAAPWSKGYGNPQFVTTSSSGFMDVGEAQLSGNQTTGDAVRQQLATGVVAKKKYLLTVGVRFLKSQNPTIDYARLQAVAFNGNLSLNNIHPAPNTNVAIIGRSGKIKDCGDWSIIEMPVWTAGKNFSNIALNVFTDDGKVAKLQIDNVTLCETTQNDCDELTLDAKGQPIPPNGYGGPLPASFTCIAEEQDDEYSNGGLGDLYNNLYGYDGTTNWYANAKDKCFSLGGTIPAEVNKFNCDDSLKMLGIKISCDELQKRLANPDLSKIPSIKPPRLPVIPTPQNGTCSGSLPNAVEMPFKGRDIIFIHGLQLDHLCDRANGVKGAQANWPDALTQQEFYSGYYNSIASANFMPHILHYLQQKGHKNRFLIVSYNCAQSAEIAAHCVLTQIREAMETGKGVIMQDPHDSRGTSCFAREYIFVSHSTGALVADVALSIANMTKTNTTLKTIWGDIGLLSDRCKGRVSFRGAFGGSNLATLLVEFQADADLSMLASGILTKKICKTDFSLAVHQTMVLNSVLVDLMPPITKLRWGNYLQAVPVPVIEISGGHPSDITPPFLKARMHPGFDDGVLTVDCSAGNSTPVVSFNSPSRFRATKSIRVFDMGHLKQSPLRSRYYYRDQAISTSMKEFASGVTPYLSPTGMVQPVDHVLSAATRYGNHYTFIQSASEHWLEDNYSSGKYEPTKWEKSSNWEEQLVVENYALFSSGIINPDIASEMTENIKEKVVYYPALRIKMVKGIPRPIIVWKKFYIWKRTYHLLRDPNLYDYDYAYKYLFRN